MNITKEHKNGFPNSRKRSRPQTGRSEHLTEIAFAWLSGCFVAFIICMPEVCLKFCRIYEYVMDIQHKNLLNGIVIKAVKLVTTHLTKARVSLERLWAGKRVNKSH